MNRRQFAACSLAATAGVANAGNIAAPATGCADIRLGASSAASNREADRPSFLMG